MDRIFIKHHSIYTFCKNQPASWESISPLKNKTASRLWLYLCDIEDKKYSWMDESNLSMNEQKNKQIMSEYLYLKINLPPEKKKYIYTVQFKNAQQFQGCDASVSEVCYPTRAWWVPK